MLFCRQRRDGGWRWGVQESRLW